MPDAEGYVALTNDAEGGQYFDIMIYGSTKNVNHASNYYTGITPYSGWSNYDSSPTTIAYTDSFCAYYIAPRAGKITNIKIQGTTAGTAPSDPFKFYIMKGAMSNDSATVSLSHMFNTSTITPPTVNRTWSHTEDFSSSNTFAEDDMIFVWYKKDSTAGTQTIAFNMNLNGYLT